MDLIFPGVFEERCKTHRLDPIITQKPRGLYVKHHIFFYLQYLVTPTDRELRPSLSPAVRGGLEHVQGGEKG
jgi:hypothetical protein